MTDKIQQFWDNQAGKYDMAEKQFAPVYQDILAKTAKYLALSDQVLDFGCATGTKTLELAGKVRHIHGLDISEGMIREALKKKDERQILNVTFSQGSIFDELIVKSSYDKVIAFGILHLMKDYEKVIRRIYEILKPGGIFISTTACFKHPMDFKTKMQVMMFFLMKKLGLTPLHLNKFMPADVEKVLKDQGFQIIEAEKFVEGIPAVFVVAAK